MDRLDFYLDDNPVGFFSAEKYPTTTGWHTYNPYRGVGRLRFACILKSGEAATVWFPDGEDRRIVVMDSESLDVERPEGRWQVHIPGFPVG
ncbi:MAG: hypothetical protein AAF483_29785 [Planctomycetota bacterium]